MKGEKIMNKTKALSRILAVVLAVVTVFGLTACTPGGNGGDAIYIEASLAGYRRQWLDGIAEKYEQEKGVEVEINWDSSLTTNITNLMNINSNMSDIYYVNVSGGTAEFRWNLQGKLESLNDVFAADNGTGKTIAESLKSGFEGAGLYNGNRYAIYTMAGYDCLVYNPDILAAAGWDKPFPATVDGLIEMFEVINKKSEDGLLKAADGTAIKPFVYTGVYDSISHMFDAFELQYGGVDEYAAFYAQSDRNGPDQAQYKKKATEVAFENMKKIMAVNLDGIPKYVLPGSAGMTHTEAQTAFLNGYAAVCTTGTWFETEMSNIIEPTDKYEIAPFPLAADELGSFGAAEQNLIDPDGEVVPENMMRYNTTYFASGPFYIPKKALNKEGAKDFLKFMLQEENIRYMHEQTGNALNFEYNRENLDLSGWARKVETNNQISITGAKGANNVLYLVGALGGWRSEVWTGLESNKNFDYKAAMATRLQDVQYGWQEKVELI